MQKKLLLISLSIFILSNCTSRLNAQIIENSINLSGTNFPHEKIHIHFDRESYLPGETIWFKAYLFEEDLPSERSTNFYAALYDEAGKLIQQHMSPVLNSSSNGQFIIPDTLKASQVLVRAYTGWMMNFDTSFFYNQSIKIISTTEKINPGIANNTASLQFFPEGGNLVEGVVNTIAFKANYNNGLPYYLNGVIKKQETGEVMMPLIVVHDGMGKFDIDIEPGNKYYAEWIDENGNKQQTYLPAAKPGGVSLKLSVQKDKVYYNIVNKSGNDSLHVLMYMYQKVFYKNHVKVKSTEPFTAVLPVNKLPSGTMQLTVFDANWQPVAERVAFINNNNFTLNTAIHYKEISTQKRGKNIIEISVADTIPANMSLSISDADMNDEYAGNTIVSDFLLRGDVKGYIHNPAYYFTNNTDASLKSKLDLVMLTHGWRRYNWADMLVQKMPVLKFASDDYLGVYGQVGKEAMRKMQKGEQVTLIIKSADSTNSFYSIQPDNAGLLKQTGLIFYDSASLYFTFDKSKILNRQMAFSKSNFTLEQSSAINNFKNYLLPDNEGMVFNENTILFNYYKKNNGIYSFNEEKTMQSVVVKTGRRRNWQNDPLLKLDEKYATGLFAGGTNAFSLDVLHDEKAEMSLDIYNYITNKIPGLTVRFSREPGGGKEFLHRNGIPVIYIDGTISENSVLQNLPVNQIAYIKFFEKSVSEGPKESSGLGGSGFTPVLVIYMKKGDDLIDRRPKENDLGLIKIAGYSPTKEFYAPDYEQSNTTTGTDARTTLLWVPYIFTDATNRKVPITFYNNDFTKKMRIVLEGINEEGKMIRIEKIIE